MFWLRQLISLTFKQLKKVSLRRRRRKVTKWIFLLLFSSLVLIFMFLLNGKAKIMIKLKIMLGKKGCPKYFLPEEHAWEYGSCLPHQASNESCENVRTLYKVNPALTKCKASSSKRVCQLLHLPAPKHHDDFKVTCDNSICIEHSKNESIQVLNVNPSNGQITEAGKFFTTTDLEAALMDIIRENIKQKFHFVILRCTSKDTKKGISQLVPIDPQLTIRKNASNTRDPNLLNVNIVLLDSVSRAHFYRSLPKTIELFKRWRNKSRSAPAMIFDFELFQAVEGHTKENTHALFNGKLLNLDSSQSSQSVNPGFMFSTFQRAGYQTMWQEDLCWKGVWGLLLDLLAGGWGNLAKRLQEHFIDHSGKIRLKTSCLFTSTSHTYHQTHHHRPHTQYNTP